MIDSAPALARRARELEHTKVLALDTEFMRTNTYWPKLALIQIADAQTIELIDPVAIESLAALKPLLDTPHTITVMHSASEDLIALKAISRDPLGGLFDTQIGAAFSGMDSGIGYQRLVAELLGHSIEKGEQRSDWLQRPLSAKQLQYAASDVVHLLEIHALLSEKLTRRGMLAWAEADCARMAADAAVEQLPTNPQLEFKSIWHWPLADQARLKRLLDWREAQARALDRPRNWLFDGPAALALIERPPRRLDELPARLGDRRALPARLHPALLDLLNQPLDADPADLVPVPPPLDDAAEARFENLRDRLKLRAAELDIPAALIAPRRVLEALARDPANPAIAGWRRELLQPLLDAL